MERASRASYALICVGVISILNGFIANTLQAEKSYSIRHFTNTHWITSITLFAGISVVTCEASGITRSFVFTILCNIIALVVSFAATIADFINICVLLRDFGALKTNSSITTIQAYGLLSYSVVDFLLSGLSIALLLTTLVGNMRNIIDYRRELSSKVILWLGIALIATSTVKLFAWIIELYQIRSLGNLLRFSFLHYTIDEPVWILLNLSTGVFTFLSYERGDFFKTISLCLSAISIHPTITYLWIDYRWFTTTIAPTAGASVFFYKILLFTNVITGLAHITLLTAISFYLLMNISPIINMKLSSNLRLLLILIGSSAVIVAIILFAFDIGASKTASFYKIFHSGEQKTPFLVMATAILLLIVTHSRKSYSLVLPATFAFSLFGIQSTFFFIFTYIYLSWNGYFVENICELFYMSSARCADLVNKTAAIVHFLEAFVHVAVLVAFIIIAFILWRIIQNYSVRPTFWLTSQQRRIPKYENIIKYTGLSCLIWGAITLQFTIKDYISTRSQHPLIVILSSLYHISLGTTLVIFPLYQVVVSTKLYKNPLHCITLVMICVLRFIEIFTQLDYRNIGETSSFSWKLHNAVEVFSLGAYFTTTVLCLKIMDLSSGEIFASDLPSSFTEFRNPLSQSDNPYDYQRVLSNAY